MSSALLIVSYICLMYGTSAVKDHKERQTYLSPSIDTNDTFYFDLWSKEIPWEWDLIKVNE